MTESDALAALAQFDLVSALMIREVDPRGFYPNAAKFSEALVEPMIIEQLRDTETPLRQHVYAGDQAGLREGLRDYDELARLEAAKARRANREWQWRGYETTLGR